MSITGAEAIQLMEAINKKATKEDIADLKEMIQPFCKMAIENKVAITGNKKLLDSYKTIAKWTLGFFTILVSIIGIYLRTINN